MFGNHMSKSARVFAVGREFHDRGSVRRCPFTKCEWCGGQIQSRSVVARFCSEQHRKRAENNRRRKAGYRTPAERARLAVRAGVCAACGANFAIGRRGPIARFCAACQPARSHRRRVPAEVSTA
jgi:hypothetical protein